MPTSRHLSIIVLSPVWSGISESLPNTISDPKLVQETYDKMVSDYDNINGEAFYANQYEVYEMHMARFLNSRYRLSLDLGCGTGLQSLPLASKSDLCVGVDLSPGLLSLANKKRAGLKNLEFVRCDIAHMPFREEVFDCVVSYGEVISHLRQYGEAFGEVSRISAPGALFLVTALNKWNLSLIYAPRELLGAMDSKVGQERSWSIDIPPYMERVSLRLKTFSRSEISDILTRNGFRAYSRTGIHILSLIIPLRLQYDSSGFWWHCFRFLGRLDLLINDRPPFWWLGYTVVISTRKKVEVI